MVKKIIAAFCLLISLIGVYYWYLFVKEKPVTDSNLMLCLNNNRLTITTFEDMKIVCDVEATIIRDTLKIHPKTTTILNPFAKNRFYTISLKPNIKYIKAVNKTMAVTEIKQCQF